MQKQTWRRWAATTTACAVAVLGVALAGVPAHAEPASGPVLALSVAGDRVGLPEPADPGDAPQISWGLNTPAGTTVKDVHVTLDVSGITSFADVGSPCAGDTCVWDRGDVSNGGTGGLVDVNAKPGVPLGTTGEAVLSGTAADATITGLTVRVTVGVVGLVVDALPQTDHAKPGSTLDAPLTVADNGQLTADGVNVEVTTTTGLDFARHFSNCTYAKVANSVIPTLTNQAVCHIAGSVEPGAKYRLSAPFGIDVTSSALWEMVRYRVTPISGSVPSGAHGSSGSVLSLVRDGAAPASGVAGADWTVDADNTADLSAGGDSAHGEPGDKVVLTASMRNDGPASVDVETSDNQLGVMVDIPKGTTAVKVPPKCNPWDQDGPGAPALGAPTYICEVDPPFSVGDVVRLPFTLKIGADAPAVTTGEVRATTVYDLGLPFDHYPADNTARLTVNVEGAATASTGVSDSAGGSSSGGNQANAQTGPQADPSSGTTGSTDPAATGSLASTGGDGTRTVAWTGAAALALGGAIFAFVRSRKLRA
jgi:LPXTG-motif cell wall-anchored protein